MKSLGSRMFGNTALTGILLLGASFAIPSAGHAADWLDSIQDQRCAPEDIAGVSNNARNAIEASVRRAEMAIQAPTPVGDLGCLNDLMTAPLDLFSGIGGLLTNLQTGLQSFDMGDLNIDIDVSGMICQYAAEKFAELTEPLSGLDKTISGYAALSADPGSRLSGIVSSAFQGGAGGIWNDTFSTGSSTGSTRISSGYTVAGIASRSDSSGYSGNVSDFVAADMTATESDVIDSIFPDEPTATPENSAAWATYNQQMMRSFAEYVGCRIGRSLDGTRVVGSHYGTGYWDVPGSTCNFSFVAYPTSVSATPASVESAPARVAPRAQSAVEPAAAVDRDSGQPRPEAVQIAPIEKKGATATIWEQLVK